MKYASIQANDIANGIKGLCVSFWVSGCHFHCEGCQNKELWNFDYGKDLPNNYLQILDDMLEANGINRNLSILGGEPLCEENRTLIRDIVDHVRSTFQDRKSIAIWTGYNYEDLIAENDDTINFILRNVDVLIDGRYDKTKRNLNLKLRGSSNQRVLYLEKNSVNIEKIED